MRPQDSTDVPCNGCIECCRSGQALVLHPELGDDVRSYRFRILTDRASEKQLFVLASDEQGGCVYLSAAGCSIYERRPLLCRSFDCRKHYLTLPRQDRDNLVKLGLSSRAVFNAGRSRAKSLSPGERGECDEKRKDLFAP